MGFLSAAMMVIGVGMGGIMVCSTHFGEWYGLSSLVAVVFIVALAAFGVLCSLSGRSRFD